MSIGIKAIEYKKINFLDTFLKKSEETNINVASNIANINPKIFNSALTEV